MNRTKPSRITLRKFKPEDWKDLHEYLSDEQVVQYEPYDAFTEEESKESAEGRADSEAFLAIVLEETGKVIGNVYFAKHGPESFDTWMIGYVMNRHYWGQGYASQAVQALLDRLFTQEKAHRVIARCNIENTASWRLLERNGFRREASYKKNAFFKRDEAGNPLWHNAYEYAILREEWSDRR